MLAERLLWGYAGATCLAAGLILDGLGGHAEPLWQLEQSLERIGVDVPPRE